jgi:hypothetical protein
MDWQELWPIALAAAFFILWIFVLPRMGLG